MDATLISTSDDDDGGIWKTIGKLAHGGVIHGFHRHEASLIQVRARAFKGMLQGLSADAPLQVYEMKYHTHAATLRDQSS